MDEKCNQKIRLYAMDTRIVKEKKRNNNGRKRKSMAVHNQKINNDLDN